jgi:hypothetical protein
MNEHADFVAKLRQIEELASSLGAELHASLPRTRAQHIALLARAMRGRLELGSASVVATGAAAGPAGEEKKPPR